MFKIFIISDDSNEVEMSENPFVAVYYTTKHSWRGKYKRLLAVRKEAQFLRHFRFKPEIREIQSCTRGYIRPDKWPTIRTLTP